jgi:hypothetical protein
MFYCLYSQTGCVISYGTTVHLQGDKSGNRNKRGFVKNKKINNKKNNFQLCLKSMLGYSIG